MILDLKKLKLHSSNTKVLVAYSGGLDSHVLLHLVSQSKELSVRAIHVHHGLQSVADDWVEHCQLICKQLNIPLDVVYLKLSPQKGESIEAIARQGRYQAFQQALLPNEILLTAQHQNDQSETLLLQLFRGAGVQGLASMPIVCNFGSGKHARPLLSSSREELEAYADKYSLKYIEDPSNKDLSFDRNFLRQEIFPKLRKRWLGLDKALNRSATIQAETKQLLDEVAAEDIKKISTPDGNIVIDKLKTYSLIRQKLLIRYWIVKNGFTVPSEKKLQHLFSDVINSRIDASPLVEWKNVQVRRYKDQLYIMQTLTEHNPAQFYTWDTREVLQIKSLNLTLKPNVLHRKKQTVTVRFRQGGEKIYIEKRKKTARLKNLLSEAGIPPWQRSRIPLVYIDKQLVQIIGLDLE